MTPQFTARPIINHDNLSLRRCRREIGTNLARMDTLLSRCRCAAEGCYAITPAQLRLQIKHSDQRARDGEVGRDQSPREDCVSSAVMQGVFDGGMITGVLTIPWAVSRWWQGQDDLIPCRHSRPAHTHTHGPSRLGVTSAHREIRTQLFIANIKENLFPCRHSRPAHKWAILIGHHYSPQRNKNWTFCCKYQRKSSHVRIPIRACCDLQKILRQ